MIAPLPRWLRLLAAFVCAAALGCRENAAPTVPLVALDPPIPALTTDEKVLMVLDFYDPMYKVDANGRVTHLRLSGRHVPSTIMAEVGKLTELHVLDLYGTTVNDEGLAKLKDLQKLKSIGLGASQMTDKGLVYLANLQNLQWAWVPRQRISKTALDKLKDDRPDLNVDLQ